MSRKRRSTSSPVCVIAGAGPGLGTAIAERYAAEGFTSYMLLRNPARVSSAIAPLRKSGLSIVPVKCDVRSQASIAEALELIDCSGGGCDVVVYNAFANVENCATALTSERMLEDLHVNVAAALSLIRLTIEPMRAVGTGTILFSGCGLAQLPSAAKTSLSVGKAALRALVDCLAAELEPSGIRVGLVTITEAAVTGSARLASIAELYWRLFMQSDLESQREIRWPL
jgi:NAD(P)-dependent dehydrogenase (short-subunit alcohol dehydrogenase family)